MQQKNSSTAKTRTRIVRDADCDEEDANFSRDLAHLDNGLGTWECSDKGATVQHAPCDVQLCTACTSRSRVDPSGTRWARAKG